MFVSGGYNVTVSEGSVRSGLNYISARLDQSGEAYILDAGRDEIHSEPIVFVSWPESSSEESGSFIETLFEPEHLAKNYSPDENMRVGYDDSFDDFEGELKGSWSGVDVYDIGRDRRLEFREGKESAYRPDEQALNQFYDQLS